MTECKDCRAAGLTNNRPAPHPGPRCATHSRAAKKLAKTKSHGRRVQSVYQLPPEGYEALYEAQGGKCAICRRATGASRKLSVDHDHKCCPATPTCGRCTRGLLCATCNQLLGHGRDDPEFFRRAARYLENPPAPAVLIGMDR